MATNDLIPLFPSDHTEELGQPGIEKAWDRAVNSSRILKTSILVVTAAAIVFAILLVGNPLVLFVNATASRFATSAPQDGTGQSMPIVQSTVDAQALPPTAPTGNEIAAAFKTAYDSRTEIRQPSAEALFDQFQAWTAEEDARAQGRTVQPVQDAQAQVVQNVPAQVVENAQPVRPMQKHRRVRHVQNARPELRPVQNPRAKVRREQNARVQVRPAQDARAQDQSVQNAQAPSFQQSFGWRDSPL